MVKPVHRSGCVKRRGSKPVFRGRLSIVRSEFPIARAGFPIVRFEFPIARSNFPIVRLSITHKLLARSGETVGKANSPPWQRRGECAQFKKSCEATFVGRRRGGSLNDDCRLLNQPPTPPPWPR